MVKTSVGVKYAGSVAGANPGAQLSTDKIPLLKGAIVKNPSTNSGSVYVGNSDVDATHGFQLEPGEKEFFPDDDLSKIYVYSAGGESVTYIAY